MYKVGGPSLNFTELAKGRKLTPEEEIEEWFTRNGQDFGRSLIEKGQGFCLLMVHCEVGKFLEFRV